MNRVTAQVKHAALVRDRGSLLLGGLLLVVTALAWVAVVRADAAMRVSMNHGTPSLSFGHALAFTVQWGVMMAAMMVPSAAPMILLYRGFRKNAGASSGAAIPAEIFALVYVALWMLTGIPVFLGSVAVAQIAAGSPEVAAVIPYAVALTLIAAGVYQLTPAKHACLRECEAPIDFLMRRWRPGYAATLKLAGAHALYCIGCCWALMIVLVTAGAMSLPWVLAIALVTFAEKVLPAGGRTARVVGAALIVTAFAIAVRPELASALRPAGMN